jgi:hypothetical protein
MLNLIEILKSETQTLKEQYLLKTKEWATNYYKVCESRKDWYEVEWCKFFGLTPEIKNPNSKMQFLGYPKGFYNTAKSGQLHKYQNEIHRTLTMGLEKYIEKELRYAEMHYEGSIIKLADRIEKKGLNQDKISVITSHIGVNINTTLTDGEKTVRAFTIIAEGEIQRPHYRYLIK